MLMFSRLKGLMPRFVSKDLNDVQVGYRFVGAIRM